MCWIYTNTCRWYVFGYNAIHNKYNTRAAEKDNNLGVKHGKRG